MRRFLLCVLIGAPWLAHAELGINVYGASYHFERDKAKELGFDNEVNPGLGVRWRMPRESYDWFLEAGTYRDSGRNTAVVAGGGLFWKATQRLRLGGGLAYFDSKTYNQGDPFIAPVPMVAYEWRALSVNMLYFPKLSGVNELNILGFWLTVWPEGF